MAPHSDMQILLLLSKSQFADRLGFKNHPAFFV